jgi:hypothetical protein
MNMRKIICLSLALGVMLLARHPVICAQENKPDTKAGDKQGTKTEKKEQVEIPESAPRPVTAYRLDLSINELADGRKVNTRHYSSNTTSDSSPQWLQVGTRVPVQNEGGKFDYLDVGTRINTRITRWTTPMTLTINADITSFATPEESTRQHPLLRQAHIEGTVPITSEKPIVVGVADDPASNRQFQLEVTITVIK